MQHRPPAWRSYVTPHDVQDTNVRTMTQTFIIGGMVIRACSLLEAYAIYREYAMNANG